MSDDSSSSGSSSISVSSTNPSTSSSTSSPANSSASSWLEKLWQKLAVKSGDRIRDDLEDALAESASSPSFSPQEREMLKNVLGFHRIRVDDVMVPRADILAVASDTTLGELLRIYRTAGHSRLPVYNQTLDDPRGMIHIRDFLDFLVGQAESSGEIPEGEKEVPQLGTVDLRLPLSEVPILRPVLFVPPSMPAIDLLVRMQSTRTHMALVIDEYGGTDGLVSIEDLVEMVVGDIEDEHDDAAEIMISPEATGIFLADSRADLHDVSEALGMAFIDEEWSDEIDTLGGLIVTLAGRVPARGELISGPSGLEFEILDADPRRLKKVRIYRHIVTSEQGSTPLDSIAS